MGVVLLLVSSVALLVLVRADAPAAPVTQPVSEVVVPSSVAPQPNRAPTPRRSRGTPSAHPPKPQRVAAAPEPHAFSALEVAAPAPESSEPAAAPVVPAPEPDAPLVAAAPVVPAPEPDAEPLAPEVPPAEPPAEPAAWDGNGESIARAIADAKRAAVRACFERELKQQPKLAGTVVVELDLAAPNRIEALRVSDDLNRPEFTRCVTNAMQGVRFAALDEDISVRVPYVLSPVKH